MRMSNGRMRGKRSLGEEMRDRLEMTGWTQAHLAEYLDLSQGEISRLVGDRGIPGLLNGKKVAEFLDVTLDEVIDLASETERRRNPLGRSRRRRR